MSDVIKQPLSEREMERWAWFAVIRICLTVMVILAAVVGAVWFIGFYGYWGKLFFAVKWILLVLFCIGALLTLVFALVALKDKLKAEKFNLPKPSSWSVNETGICPQPLYVNIQRKSGLVEWKVRSITLDWSLEAGDPITEWLPVDRKKRGNC